MLLNANQRNRTHLNPIQRYLTLCERVQNTHAAPPRQRMGLRGGRIPGRGVGPGAWGWRTGGGVRELRWGGRGGGPAEPGRARPPLESGP